MTKRGKKFAGARAWLELIRRVAGHHTRLPVIEQMLAIYYRWKAERRSGL